MGGDGRVGMALEGEGGKAPQAKRRARIAAFALCAQRDTQAVSAPS